MPTFKRGSTTFPTGASAPSLPPARPPKRTYFSKLREYFKGGASRVWIVDPASRSARIFTSPRQFTLVGEDDPLDAGDLLPGFKLTLKEWFACARRRPAGREEERGKGKGKKS